MRNSTLLCWPLACQALLACTDSAGRTDSADDAPATQIPAWLGEHRSGRAVWFTYDGATLHALRDVGVDVGDLERVAG